MARWRLRPDPVRRHRHVRVVIYRTLGDMREALRRDGLPVVTATGRRVARPTMRRAWGACTYGVGREIATVTLALPRCQPSTVCHELLHATMAYLNRFPPTGKTHFIDLQQGPLAERLADFNGNLNREFWDRFHAEGLA